MYMGNFSLNSSVRNNARGSIRPCSGLEIDITYADIALPHGPRCPVRFQFPWHTEREDDDCSSVKLLTLWLDQETRCHRSVTEHLKSRHGQWAKGYQVRYMFSFLPAKELTATEENVNSQIDPSPMSYSRIPTLLKTPGCTRTSSIWNESLTGQ